MSRRSRCPDAVVTGGANDGASRWSPEASDAVVLCAYALRARGPAGAEPGRGAVSEGGRQSECAGSAGMVKSTSASSADRHLLPPANLARISSW